MKRTKGKNKKVTKKPKSKAKSRKPKQLAKGLLYRFSMDGTLMGTNDYISFTQFIDEAYEGKLGHWHEITLIAPQMEIYEGGAE
jgi:hypothetical protein